MGRLIKWLVGLVIIFGLIYVGLVAVTGSKVRDITEQQLQIYNAQTPDAEVELNWHETSFWRSEGEMRITMQVESETLDLIQSITLQHGALRAKVRGELTGQFAGSSLNEMFFNRQPVILEGRVGLAGARLTYAVPALTYIDEELDISYTVSAFETDLVLQEQEQHSKIQIDWIEVETAMTGAADVMRWEGIEATTQSRLNPKDKQFEYAQSMFSIEEMVYGTNPEASVRVENLRNETDMTRVEGNVEVKNSLTVDTYEVSSVTGELTFNMTVGPVPFASFQALQNGIEDPAILNAFLHDTQKGNAKLVIEELELSMGQMGNLSAHGEFQLRDDINFEQGFTAGSAGDFLQGELEVQDLPLLLLMPLSGVVSGELPWKLELREGDLLINGEALNLP